MPHIEPSKLFGAVEGRLDDKEGRHLEECQDCRRAVFQTHIDEDGRERRTDSGMRLVRRFMQGDRVCVIGPIAPDLSFAKTLRVSKRLILPADGGTVVGSC